MQGVSRELMFFVHSICIYFDSVNVQADGESTSQVGFKQLLPLLPRHY